MRQAVSGLWGAVALAGLVAGAAAAEDVPVETGKVGGSAISLHVQPFLTAEELALLRLVLTSKDALAVFTGAGEGADKGHAALAVNPDEGLLRDGQPVKSAVALAGFDTAEAASGAALKGCGAAARSKTPCVVVLEVSSD